MAKANTFFKADKELLIFIGQKIRKLRRDKGLTIEELSENCSLNAKYIQSVETGKRNISISALKDLLEGAGSDLEVFFSKE